HPIIGASFIGAESVCFLLFLLAGAGAWRLRFKPQETPLASPSASVAVFITVCGEPTSIVARTVAAAVKIQWNGPLHIYLLDDGGSADVEALARRYEVSYRSRMREGRLL